MAEESDGVTGLVTLRVVFPFGYEGVIRKDGDTVSVPVDLARNLIARGRAALVSPRPATEKRTK